MNIKTNFLTINKYSRPQWPMESHLGIVMHWVGNAGTSAEFNRNYFEICKKKGPKVSAHFIIDSKEIIQCMPLEEEAFHLRYPRRDLPYKDDMVAKYGIVPSKNLIGIELCHPDQAGWFEAFTLQLAEELCCELCEKYGINPIDDIIRHFDVTGKCCPKWWIQKPDEFLRFKLKVKEYEIQHEKFRHQREHWL